MYAHKAEHWHMCPYIIIAYSVNGYILLTECMSFTPWPMSYVRKSTIKTTTFKIRQMKHGYCQHGYWSFHYSIEHPDGSREEFSTNWQMRRIADNDDNYHEYRIWPYQEEKSNTIPTSPLAVIISQRSYNEWYASTAMTMIITITGFDPTNQRNWIPFLQVNWARSSVGEPTIHGTILPLNRQYREPKARSTDNCESAHPVYLQLKQPQSSLEDSKNYISNWESQNGGDNKCNFQPFISEPAETTSSYSNNHNTPNSGNSK